MLKLARAGSEVGMVTLVLGPWTLIISNFSLYRWVLANDRTSAMSFTERI